MAAPRRALPERANLDQQRKLAKELLAAFRRGDDEARERIRAELPDKQRIVLADAQLVLAREYGFASWRELKQRIEERGVDLLPPVERFQRAVRDADAAALRALLPFRRELQEAVNAPSFSFDSPALVAVAGRDGAEVVDALLALGADPNRRSAWWAGGFHPLHGATGPAAERLLAAGAIPDACAAAHLDRLDLLADMLAEEPARVHERGGDGQTPLHFARSRAVVDLLLDAGADIDARDVDHRSTPAEWMLGDVDDAARSRVSLASYLVERGANADIFLVAALGLTSRGREMLERDPSLLSLRTGQGAYGEKPPSSYHIYFWTIGSSFTPLETAARFHQRETLEVMTQLASPEQRLLLACHEANRAEAQSIARANPGIVQALAGADRAALTDEAWRANGPAVDLMMELGFDPAAIGGLAFPKASALHCAAWEGSVECVTAILRYPAGRALVGVRDVTFRGTPLNWCSHGSVNCGNPKAHHPEVARLLIAAGARPDPEMTGGSDEFQAVIDEASHA